MNMWVIKQTNKKLPTCQWVDGCVAGHADQGDAPYDV